jgi:hypothetical protein
MNADQAALLSEFARVLKGAARAVSLYPPGHPTLQASLTRMVATGEHVTGHGPFVLTVLPDALLVEGRRLPRPDTGASDVARLLHEHLIGEFRLTGAPNAGSWHMLLTILSRSPEDVQAEGGIAKAWQAGDGGPIVIREIDYAEVLREREGAANDATWDEIIVACLAGDPNTPLEGELLRTLLDIARDEEQLRAFMSRLQDRSKGIGLPVAPPQKQALLRLLHGLANYLAAEAPDEFDTVMTNLAAASTRLSPDLLLSILTEPPPPGSITTAAPVDLGGELQSRFSDDLLGAFVADNVSRDRRATGRLVEAFHALAPDEPHRQDALARAEEQIALTDFANDPQFESLWSNAMSMLMSYSDTEYVPEDYGRELDYARTRAVEVEAISDDPPDRIAAWMATVDGDDVRALDQQMLGDLLRIEERPDAWASMLEVALGRLEQFVMTNELGLANPLLHTIADIGKKGAAFAPAARAGLARLTSGPIVQHVVQLVRHASEAEMPQLVAFCHGVGPALAMPLTGALAQEESRLSVRRLKDVLIGFGEAAASSARQLRSSSNPAVRRAAIDLLRAVGGSDVLSDLGVLLADSDPQVQREAVRAIVQVGSAEAFGILEKGLKEGGPGTREAILNALAALRDPRALPMLQYILAHLNHRGPQEGAYVSAIEALGHCGSTAAEAATLKTLLYRREWFAPARTSRIRAAAARALHAMSVPAADEVLREAAASGGRSVRAAAELAMKLPRRPRTEGVVD